MTSKNIKSCLTSIFLNEHDNKNNNSKKCFTPADLTQSFFDTCEFEIHPTNAGNILKETNVKIVGYTQKGSKLYDGKCWEYAFEKLYEKCLTKCQFDQKLIPPTNDKSIPDCPQYYEDLILRKKPFVKY